MAKRPLSPAPLLPPKRPHTNQSISSPPLLNFDNSLYDELVLVIFSHLSWVDLCALQSTNRYWSRLTTDNQLWKSLYLREYGRPRLRGLRGFVGRHDGREIKPLPAWAKPEDVKDWKWMFRISSNWRKGRCLVEHMDGNQDCSSSSVPALYPEDTVKIHVVLLGSLMITTSPTISRSPPIYLHRQAKPTHTLLGIYQEKTPTHLTTLSLDQSPPPPPGHAVRLAAFYETGEFAVFLVNHQTPSSSRRLFSYIPTSTTSRTSPITQAVYHHPLLITLSKSFHLSLYNLSEKRVTHTQTLTSFTSFPPTSLVLSTPLPTTYKLVLAYAMPVYPAHWSVAATELTISSAAPSLLSTPCTVTHTRTTRAFDFPPGRVDEAKLRTVREQWGRKVGRVADTQTDGKWVVLAPGDGAAASTLQLYRLHLPVQSHSASPRLSFVRSLHGHVGPVSALSLSDGRCVSLGADGSLWVWDLESGWGTEAQNTRRNVDVGPSRTLGAVVFDERRIISADKTGIEIRRFDI